MAHILFENILLRLVNRDEALLVRNWLVDRRLADWDTWLSVVNCDAHLEIWLSIVEVLVS